MKALRKIPWNYETHLGAAVVERAAQFRIAADYADKMKVLAGLKMLEQILALLAAFAIKHKNG